MNTTTAGTRSPRLRLNAALVLMVLAGAACLAAPWVAGVGVSFIVALLILFGGVTHFLHAINRRPLGSTAWHLRISREVER
jgi:uncharacterized membrane protein HdeD (DUF308 family)